MRNFNSTVNQTASIVGVEPHRLHTTYHWLTLDIPEEKKLEKIECGEFSVKEIRAYNMLVESLKEQSKPRFVQINNLWCLYVP